MWAVSNTMIRMSEGDFGVALPFSIQGVTLTPSDCIKFVFKAEPNGVAILEKEYTNISENSANLSFTAAESELFDPGFYCYTVDLYQSGSFKCTLIENGVFKVGDVA